MLIKLVKSFWFLLLVTFSGCDRIENLTLTPSDVPNKALATLPQPNSVIIKIEPRDDSKQISQAIEHQFINGESKAPLILHESGLFFGLLISNVYSSKSNAAEVDILSVQGPDIIAIPVPAHSVTSAWSKSLGVRSAFVEKDGAFNIRLLSNTDYTMIINPRGENSRPPTFVPVRLESAREIVLSDRFSKISGTIVNNTSQKTSIAMTIKVLQNSTLVSSVATSDENGSFSLFVPTTLNTKAGPLLLQISAEAKDSYLPVFSYEGLIPAINSNSIDIGKIDIGSLSASALSVKISAESGEPLENIAVYVKGKFPKGTCNLQLATNSEGIVTTPVLPGSYMIVAIPPHSSEYAAFADEQTGIGSGAQNINITLKKRKTIEGVVLDHEQQPVEGATLEFLQISTSTSSIDQLRGHPTSKMEAKTDVLGTWCKKTSHDSECLAIAADEGQYQINILPPLGKPLPYYSTVISFSGQDKKVVILPKPNTIEGQVFDFTGKIPVAGAYVSIYSASRFYEGEPILLGIGYTDDLGNFSAYVAPN